jgi:hypothetical protein
MRRVVLRAALAAALLLPPAISSAALGAGEASIEADRAQFNAARIARPMQGYTVHELSTPNGTTIREFTRADGSVFAVSWQGPFLPDLRTLLGAYFGSLQTAPRTAALTHSKLLLEGADVVIHSEGHVRAFSGQAYLPQLVPAGVDGGGLR